MIVQLDTPYGPALIRTSPFEIDVPSTQQGQNPMNSPETREALATYAHEAWSGWMRYLFEKSQANADGTVTIPAWAVERWTRQMNTPYAGLPEDEKNSDRGEADRMLAIVKPQGTKAIPDPNHFHVPANLSLDNAVMLTGKIRQREADLRREFAEAHGISLAEVMCDITRDPQHPNIVLLRARRVTRND